MASDRVIKARILATALAAVMVGATFTIGSRAAVVTTGSATSGRDLQGWSVGMSGRVAVAGAPGTANRTGNAYIFAKTGSAWHSAATLNDPRNAARDQFGYSVAASAAGSKTYVVIGENDYHNTLNYVYVYTGSGRTWHRQASIGDPVRDNGDVFGGAVALSGTILVIGAPGADGYSGMAYVYHLVKNRWILQANLSDPPARALDLFGQAVAVSGETVIIGAHDSAYVYTRTAGLGWAHTGNLRNPGEATDNFGASVAISRGVAAIGAPGPMPTDSVRAQAGSVYVYSKPVAKWQLRQRLTPPVKAGEFGFSVAVTGPRILIGTPLYTDVNCGTAFDFLLTGGRWRERAQLVDGTCHGGVSFGFSVAVSGRAAIIGEPGAKESVGTVYETNQLP
jgi:hypothetical protein